MSRKNKFSAHAAPYLREALKKAAKTYHHGIKPRKAVVTALQRKRDELNRQIKKEKQRGKA